MNVPALVSTLPDTQSLPDARGLTVHQAGIRGIRLPAQVTDIDGRRCTTVLTAQATVTVPATQKGTHMSRFVDVLHEVAPNLELAQLPVYLARLLARLDAKSGALELTFHWFIEKTAPVSGVASLLDIQVRYHIVRGTGGMTRLRQSVVVPVTSLCPCSKAISRYGAHNQRSEVTVTAEVAAPVALSGLVAAIEAQASCEVYGLLKRADEKYVTERAYENPKFVEDMARDIYTAVMQYPGIARVTVASENFESIHNHSAFALIDGAELY